MTGALVPLGVIRPLIIGSALIVGSGLKPSIMTLLIWSGKDTIKHMQEKGVRVMALSSRTIAEEMPDAYKDVNLVVKAVEDAGLATIVAKLKPHLVIKG